MQHEVQRSEPRFALGAYVQVGRQRATGWVELRGFTVNVSEHGLLVTLAEAPKVGERLRVKLPGPEEAWVEAVVRHVIRGGANFLVGLQLSGSQGSALTRRAQA